MLIEYSDPHFFFHDFVKRSIFFKKEKNQQKSMASFLAICAKGAAWRLTHIFYFFTKFIFLPHRGVKNRLLLHSARYRGLRLKKRAYLSIIAHRTWLLSKEASPVEFVGIMPKKWIRPAPPPPPPPNPLNRAPDLSQQSTKLPDDQG